MKRRTYHFSGQVQGVGFRYTTRNIAQQYNVRGYVRNLPDGLVELVMEGDDQEMHRLIEELKRRMEGYIDQTTVTTSPLTGEFTEFSIRH